MRLPVRLLVVAKAPVAGEAKTRLIPALGPEGAAEAAAAALLDTLDAVHAAARLLAGRAPGLRPVVALTGDLGRAERGAEIRAALAACDVMPQRGTDFGRRLVSAHQDAGPGPVLQIGMDTPQVTAALLLTCADLLADSDGEPEVDAVVGPADDGGWWVLGVGAARYAGPLAGVPMSTADTGRLTVEALRAEGRRVLHAPGLRDVDTIEDALAVAALAPGTRFASAITVSGICAAGRLPAGAGS